MPTFNLDFFNPKEINDGAICVMIGKRGTGKSTLLYDILYRKRRIPDGLVFAGSQGAQNDAKKHVPESFIYNEWDPDAVKKLISRQKKENRDRDRKGLPPKYAFLVIDDCAYDDKFCNDKQLKELFMNGRWLRIFVIFTMQYSLGLKPLLRGQVDNVFILREVVQANQKRLYEHWCGVFPDLTTFREVLMQTTNDYQCLVVKNTGNKTAIKDIVYHYKAVPDRKYKMGSKSFWRAHYESYNSHWESDEEEDEDDGPEGISLMPARRQKGQAVKVRMLPNPSFKRRKGKK